LNADNESNAGNLGFYLPRVSLTSVKQELNGAPPLNGALVWNTNDEFYLGKGVYVWGDTVWVPIQRTPIGNSTYQSITTDPFVTVLSSPTLGLGATFQVPAAYADMGNTSRFLWEIKAIEDPAYVPEVLISGSRHEVVFVPYDHTERKYEARAKAISSNGTSDSEWSAWMETSNKGKYQGWYMLTGATGYDIKATDYNDATKGRDAERIQMSLTGNTYTVETVAGINSVTYLWSIEEDETGGLAYFGGDVTNAMVELKFKNSILNNVVTEGGWQAVYENMTGWRPGEGNSAQTWWGRQMKSPTAVTSTTSGVSNIDGTGFNALLVGNLDNDSAVNYGTGVFYWSSNAGGATVAWRRYLRIGDSGAYRATAAKYCSFSVRCKKL
jgi:hypothetical protein